MINTKSKIITIIIMILLGLIIAAPRAFDRSKNVTAPNIKTVSELAEKKLGGVAAKMPKNSVKILFEGILGLKLRDYEAYASVEETLYALRVNEIQAAWFPDVTAAYLLKKEEGIKEVLSQDIVEDTRCEFALALRPDDIQLRDSISMALTEMKEDGRLHEIIERYIDWTELPEPFYEKNMQIRQKGYSYSDTITIGITGATPPIDMLDIENRPYGFCVALMDEIAMRNGINVKFVIIKNEAAFTCLMGGKIDAIFCYGKSKSTFDPENADKNREYIMTEGYYWMNKYSFLCLEYIPSP